MARPSDWERRLGVLIDRHRATPFCWGSHDCHTWGVAVIEAVTGERRAFVQPYAGLRGAVRALRGYCQGGYREAVEKALGGPPSASYPSKGDLVLADKGPGRMPAVGVHLGDKVAFPGPEGLVFERVPRERLQVWHL